MTAVSGLSGVGAVTDKRNLMPLGSSTTLDTVGYNRLPAGAAKTLSELFASVDAYLKNGYQEYTDFDDLVSDPAAPGASKRRLYFKNGLMYERQNGGTITPIGSGGGGGGAGANWQPVAGAGPTENYEYDEKVWLFEQGITQKLTLWVRVPSSYIAGRPVSMKALFYSPGATNNWKFQAVATLIRKNNDAITSTTNQNSANTGDKTNTVANRVVEASIDLSAALGTINSVGNS